MLTHKNTIKLIGDCNTKRYVCNLKRTLSSNYVLCSVVKPGSCTSELKESAKEDVSQIYHDDIIVICSGTNDYESNEFSLNLQNITNFIKINNHINIILMIVPFRYYLPNSISVKKHILILNRKLQSLVNFSPHSFPSN